MSLRFSLPEDKQYACLDCPFPEPCGDYVRDDCPFYQKEEHQKNNRGRPGVSRDPELDKKIAEFVKVGLTDSQIAKKLGKAKATVEYRRRRLGIYKKPVDDPCRLCRSRKICEEGGLTCNEKARWSGAPAAVSK